MSEMKHTAYDLAQMRSLPQLWKYCMKPWDEGGLGLEEVCAFCGIKTGGEKNEQ